MNCFLQEWCGSILSSSFKACFVDFFARVLENKRGGRAFLQKLRKELQYEKLPRARGGSGFRKKSAPSPSMKKNFEGKWKFQNENVESESGHGI